MPQNATFPTVYLFLSASFPCLVSSPMMNNTGNAAKNATISNYLLITVCQFPLFGVIANDEHRQFCKMQPFELFTYYCLPVFPVWCHRQRWTTPAMLQNATISNYLLMAACPYSPVFGGRSHNKNWCFSGIVSEKVPMLVWLMTTPSSPLKDPCANL